MPDNVPECGGSPTTPIDWDNDPSLPPPYGRDPRWDACYDAMGHDSLWNQPAPDWLWQRLGPRWFDLPVLPWVWRHWLEPVRHSIAWWIYTRRHQYPTDADWAHD